MSKLAHLLRALLLSTSVLCISSYAAIDAVEQLQTFSHQVKSAEGEFLQQQINPKQMVNGKPKVVHQTQGHFVFSRPGKFVWETQKPYEQKLIADGKQLILWDKDLNQATYRAANHALAATPAAILFGDTAIDEFFNLTSTGERGGFSWVELSPKKQTGSVNDLPYAKIAIGMLNNEPQAMELYDSFGNLVILTLSKIKTNVPVGQERFNFRPPAGAEIVRTK